MWVIVKCAIQIPRYLLKGLGIDYDSRNKCIKLQREFQCIYVGYQALKINRYYTKKIL